MDIYQTEEQQVEAIKGFWKKNGAAVMAGLALGFAGFIGFNLYNESQVEKETAIADSYQAMMENSITNSEGFTESGEQFIADNEQSNYATLTALSLAKKASTHQDWSKASEYLQTAIAKSTDAGIIGIATLRLARVQLQLEQPEAALKTLAVELPASFSASVNEIKGDAYLMQDKKDLARDAYQAALAEESTASQSLQMKLDDLAVATTL